jgi:N-acetylglucosaminyl-diphospho-decaprenol L-rhamnosyltransferase
VDVTPAAGEANVQSQVDVSVVIVSWNTRDLLLAAIGSVIADEGAHQVEIVVVDNDSHDGSADAVASVYPNVRLIRNASNVGFAAGVNSGLQNARGRHMLLLNPDARVGTGAIDTLVEYLDSNAGVGIVGPHVIGEDGQSQVSAWRFPSPTNLLLSTTYLYKLFPQSAVMNRELMGGHLPSGRVDAVSGCAFMIRRDVIRAIGMLDTGFFMYMEETDFCLRARRAGFETHYVPSAEVTHLGGRSSVQDARRNFIEYRRSQLRYFVKHHSALGSMVAHALMLSFLLLRLPYWLARGVTDNAARRRAANYWAGVVFLLQPTRRIVGDTNASHENETGEAFDSRYVVVTPAFNEEPNLQTTIDSMISQTVPPVRWVIVDDGSTDGTGSLADRAASSRPWITSIRRTKCDSGQDGLAAASEASAFNYGLAACGDEGDVADVIVKLDADLEFDPDYFKTLLGEFQRNPGLGITGGTIYERRQDLLIRESVNRHHVRGATKAYRSSCFREIGGVREVFGWDVLDELLARAAGWQVAPVDPPKLIHLRPTATRDGRFRGYARNGRMAHHVGFGPLRFAARLVKGLIVNRQYLQVAGLGFGYASSMLLRRPRLDDPALIDVVRTRQWKEIK